MSVNKELLSLIQKQKSFILTTHRNPDGDALGSELAMYEILRQLVKEVRIINYTDIPYFLEFLDPDKKAEVYSPEKHDAVLLDTDCIILVDLNTYHRTGDMSKTIANSKATKICIDHHEKPDPVFDLLISDTSAAATGHLIYNFIHETNCITMNKTIAEPLYAAIMTDTGSFRFDRTTPEIHLITAELLRAGADPYYIYDNIYDQNPFNRIKLQSRAISSLESYGKNNEVIVMVLRQKDFNETNTTDVDTDGFVNQTLSIKGAKIGLMFIELEHGFKVSLRSKYSYNVNQVAVKFGGGGHKNASALRREDLNLDEYLPIIINEALSAC